MKMTKGFLAGLLTLTMGLAGVAHAQFSSSLQGSVTDSTGAVVPGAIVTATNTDTGVSTTAITSAQGEYRVISLAPGPYDISAAAKGFATHKVSVTLLTNQAMNVPFTMTVSSASTTVEVTDQAPLLDTADSRSQLTITEEALQDLPLPGHDLLGLTTLAPGVTGLGVQGSGGNGQQNDNYAAETQVTASANGRSSVGNMFVLDGLDITSNITPGVLNLVPNPDTIKETTVQVNMFNVEYGRSSSIVQVMTSKSGTNQYHFLASTYYTANWMTARTEFQPKGPFIPFHTNNISAAASGPVPFVHQMYFFTGWEPLLGLTQSSGLVTYEDPAFTTWALQNYPNSIGVNLLKQYPATHATTTSVKNGLALFPTTCGTAAAANIPCSLPVQDSGVFNATNSRNALQWNVRLDKYFSKDRLYGNYYNTTLDLGGPSVRVGHDQPQHYVVRSLQGNETHTFSSNTLNTAAFGVLRMEGLINPTGPFHVPIITITGAWGTQLGVSKADENYIQYHYVWRDVVDHVYRTHELKAGYEGFWGNSNLKFGPLNSIPTFNFLSVPDFVQDKVYTESGVSFDPLTGQQAGARGGSYLIKGSMMGIFAQDTWKVNKKLTLTYGVRWDNFGNPQPGNSSTVEANFFYGPGSTISQQVANGYVKQVPKSFNHAITGWSPRAGFAYDPTGSGKWLVRGGFGLYHDWVTLGNVQNEFANPPAPTSVTFQVNGAGAAPIYSLGTSDTFPFGYTYPFVPSGGLNGNGGIAGGTPANIAGNDPNLHASNTMNYTVTLERSLTPNFSVAAGYSGSHSYDLFTDFAGHTTNAYYGVDINNFPGSLIANNGKFVRLSQNFGSIRYTVNGPASTYNAFIAEFKGRFLKRGFIDASYTRSSSWDDAGTYPTVQSNTGNYSQYWAPSNWDTPNRISMALAYELPGLRKGPGFLKVFTNGWKPSAITILQSGTPFTVLNGASYKAGIQPGSAILPTSNGDYNADGINSDLPNIPTYGYNIPTSRKAQLAGVFKSTDFTAPTTLPGEGNEVINGYRNPGYANTDFAILKNTHLFERANLQLRLEIYNLFNRASLSGTNSSVTSSTFGQSTNQYSPRFLQVGAKFEF